MTLLYVADERFLEHVAAPGHPEQPARLGAVHEGLGRAGLLDAVVPAAPEAASDEVLGLVHEPSMLDLLRAIDDAGGGMIDGDTAMNAASLRVARLAAGAGLTAIEALDAGRADHALCAVRPPGHHATPRRAMGFCLVNSVAVAAASLAERGERVAVLDLDAHHGNGTQDAFIERADVWYGSIHQWPFYPGSGDLAEVGLGAGTGTTVNVPVPAGTAGEEYRRAFDEVFAPALDRFAADRILVSIGFDAHRSDPLTSLGLSAGDYADLVRRVVGLGRPTIWFLEGGYDLTALADSAGSAFAALLGADHDVEPLTGAGRGAAAVDAAVQHHRGG